MPAASDPAAVAALQVGEILRALAAAGVDTDAACGMAGLAAEDLHDPAACVPGLLLRRLFHAAARLAGDPLVGLHAGACADPRGPIAYLVMASPCLESGLRHFARFHALVAEALALRLEVTGRVASLVFAPAPIDVDRDRHLMEYCLVAALRMLERAVGPRLRLTGVRLRHADGGRAAAVRAVFGCPVVFRARDYRLELASDALRARPAMANPLIAAQLAQFAETLTAGLGATPGVVERVRVATRTLLLAGHRADRRTVARRLGMSERTLQRALARDGAGFKTVRDTVLWEVAQALLSDPARSVSAVAWSVGFGDVAAFSKAFKRGTGMTPTGFRASPAAGTPGRHARPKTASAVRAAVRG